jgi:hypothetical protein
LRRWASIRARAEDELLGDLAVRASTFECAGSIALKGGTITMEGPFSPSRAQSVAAITGGTGEYRRAHGEIVVRAEADQLIVKLAG